MILGLDIGPTRTGWCCGDGKTVPACGEYVFTKVGDDHGKLGSALVAYLNATVSRFHPTYVVYERPILVVNHYGKAGGRTDNLPFLRKRYGMDFLVETYFERLGVPVDEVTLQAIKKEVAGKALAQKSELVAIARKCGLELPEGPGAEDAADAWGAWLLGLRERDKSLSREWDRRIWSPKSALL